MMLPLVAWRNIWRHKVRSLVVIMSIAVGLWAGVFMMAFTWGMYDQYIRESVETQISHLQIHHDGFSADKEVQYLLPDPASMVQKMDTISAVRSVSTRLITGGMASSAATATGIVVYGIDPDDEHKTTKLGDRVVEGDYFKSDVHNSVILGEKLAHKLKVRLKSKIVLTMQDTSGEIVAAAFRITGIYKSKNSSLDQLNVYVRFSDLATLLHTGNAAHEIAVLLQKNVAAETIKPELVRLFPGADIKTWMELSPELELIISSFNEFMYIFVGFILLALTFGIINTMLMAVLERVREIGMLMAIGMSKWRIFMMIMLETIYLAMVGGPAGLVLGYLTIHWTGQSGINISKFSQGLSAYGFDSLVYPMLDPGYYLPVSVMTVATAILSAIYPAIKAIQLNPAEALRKT